MSHLRSATGLSTAILLCMSSPAVAQPQILLCASDSGAAKPAKTNLVYSYINGKKTECMPETKLRELLARAEFEHRRDSLMADAQKSDSFFVAAIARGEKDLRGARLRMADLINVRLDKADLRGSDMSNADLRGARLAGADLRTANLSVAYCKNADFSGAKMDSVNLKGAYLNGANLMGATGLTIDMLKTAQTLFQAKMDSTLQLKASRQAPEKFHKPADGWLNNRWGPTPEEMKKYPVDR